MQGDLVDANITWPGIVTVLVALYGAGLATWNSICRRRDRRRQLKVELSLAVVAQGGLTSHTLLLKASNPGDRPVTVNIPGIFLPNRKQLVLVNSGREFDFPHELHEGKSCTAWEEQRKIAQELREEGLSGTVKLVGFYRDAVGTVYRSKPLKFNIDQAES